MLINEKLTEGIIGAAIEVHKALGPGLLESVYEECLCYELKVRSLAYKRQVELPILYKGVRLEGGYLLDVVVEETVILELNLHSSPDSSSHPIPLILSVSPCLRGEPSGGRR